MTTEQRLVLRYKRETLRMLLLRALGREDAERVACERVAEIWHRMDSSTQEAADAWRARLPADMSESGPTIQNVDWERASGLVDCPICGLLYFDHPIDPGDRLLQLHVSCDGRRWKL